MDCLSVNGFEYRLFGNTLAFMALHIGMASHWWHQRKKGDPQRVEDAQTARFDVTLRKDKR